jgi:hypothetical protein
MSCRKALARLNRQGIVNLPETRPSPLAARAGCVKLEPLMASFQGSLRQLGNISVEPVSSRYCKGSKIWFALMNRFHYLGSGPLCGAQIRYLVKSDAFGYLGALAFSSATFSLKMRDGYIGWSEAARRSNLPLVVNNARFLILPSVRVKNLASQILATTLNRLPEDWHDRYQLRPVLAETFVDPTRYSGTSYMAANWQCIGESSGRRDGVCKMIFVYPLASDWKQRLCAEPSMALGQSVPVDPFCNWAEEEFGRVRFFDVRLKQRLYTIAQDFFNRPQSNIPQACGDKAKTIGAYRFFGNTKATMDVLLEAHTEASIERIKQHPIVLAPQDTTTLDYSTHPMTEGLGPIGSRPFKTCGLILHDTLAFSQDGTPLGILDAQCWARDPEDVGKRERRKQLPIEQKESIKWLRSYRKVAAIQKLCPDTTLISMGDRESDIYELFAEAIKTPDAPRLLIRADKARQRKSDQQYLWDLMAQQPVAGSLKIHIPHTGNQKAREVWIEVRHRKVQLKPPVRLAKAEPVELWAVYATESEATVVTDNPIEWLLLTTAEVNDFNDARKRIEWYSGRWGIEVYHRTLKSGCRIKDRQLGTAERLESCLGIDMVVAWRLYHLTMLGREVPDTACTEFFSDVEWKALCCYVNKHPLPPEKPPTLKEAIFMVGAMGGHLGRKSDGFPGTQSMWRGLQQLETATAMYVIFTQHQSPNPMALGP